MSPAWRNNGAGRTAGFAARVGVRQARPDGGRSAPCAAGFGGRLPDWRKTGAFRQRGIALPGVLWVGVVLGALAAAIISLSRGDIDLAHNQRIRAEAQLAADSAARVAI